MRCRHRRGRLLRSDPMVWREFERKAALPLRLERRDPTFLVPKLYSLPVNELLGVIFGVFVVFADKVYSILDATVFAEDVRPIPMHGIRQTSPISIGENRRRNRGVNNVS